jgi:hypothetical protein
VGFLDLFKKKDEGPSELPPLPSLGTPKDIFPTGIGSSEAPPFSPTPSFEQHSPVGIYPTPSVSTSSSSASFNPPSFGQTSYNTPPATPPMTSSQNQDGKDMQIVIAKLDALRAEVESMNQRIIHIERIADQSQQKPEQKSYAERRYSW